MILTDIAITNFKNIAHAELQFSPNINGLLGRNGMGKSNLLDAIYFMSFTKSFTGMTDRQVVKDGEQFGMVRALYDRRGQREELQLGLTPGRRKSFRRQGKEYQSISRHIGAFPLVMVSPRDMDIVGGAPEERRRFIDMILSQDDPVYLDHLIAYTDLVQQRNRLLKEGSADADLFAALEYRMSAAADYITRSRSRFVDTFAPVFTRYYRSISRTSETPAMTLKSQMIRDGAPLHELLERNRSRDAILGYTATGPHRDDLDLTLDGLPVRTAASQGQSKTYTIAMRFTQYDHLRQQLGMRPLLLLDDIFDKLDSDRVANIVDIVRGENFGQIFITDTNRDHLDSIVSRSDTDYRLWEVTDGNFTPHEAH